MFSPYVAIDASSTRPKSSSTQCGSTTLLAPRCTAWRYASVAFGTESATSFTPSPCEHAKRVMSLSGRRPLVSTSRMSFWSRTYEARSRTPVSGPA
jgi:hypothetical protein